MTALSLARLASDLDAPNVVKKVQEKVKGYKDRFLSFVSRSMQPSVPLPMPLPAVSRLRALPSQLVIHGVLEFCSVATLAKVRRTCGAFDQFMEDSAPLQARFVKAEQEMFAKLPLEAQFVDTFTLPSDDGSDTD
jgi:hypothetical protein